MTIKNNDDVNHLLDATGRTGTPYREFESSADQMSAPLIDAIFGKDASGSEREEEPLGISQAPGHDLLADVFGTPARQAILRVRPNALPDGIARESAARSIEISPMTVVQTRSGNDRPSPGANKLGIVAAHLSARP